VADQVCFLRDGIVFEQGLPEQVLGDPQRPETREFLARILG
jgi:polar amino acid transport system ATP-binding protein